MDQLEDVSADLVTVKSEQCIVLKTRDAKIVLTNPVSYLCHVIFLLFAVGYTKGHQVDNWILSPTVASAEIM